nr:hypothetical protein [Bradyrhizobium sp.]
MTRALTVMALIGLLVVGAAVASILGRGDIPAPRPELASAVMPGPIANRASKTDRLAVAALAPAPIATPQAAAPANEPLRLAFASTTADIEAPNISTLPATAAAPMAPPKPKLAGKSQKSYALLSDAQIAGIKERLKLSSSQESYWPAVESALRAVARKIHETRQADPHATGATIDPDCAEVQQLKSAAMPLLFQLREDQKREVRTLARLIGLEQVASQI